MCQRGGFFFTVGLLSRGELTANVAGAEWQLWCINDKSATDLGFDRAVERRQADRSCTQHYPPVVFWRPALSLDNLAYENCD